MNGTEKLPDFLIIGASKAGTTALFRALEPVRVTRENVSSRQPRWAWLHHRMVEHNALRRWAQRRLPLALRDAITRPITAVNLKPGPKLDPELRAKLAVFYHRDLERVEALTQRDLSAWRT